MKNLHSIERNEAYDAGYCDGYKDGFNKACEPIIKAKMLQNVPIIIPVNLDEGAVLQFLGGIRINSLGQKLIDVMEPEDLKRNVNLFCATFKPITAKEAGE